MILTILFVTILCVDNLLPFVLAAFYKGYSHKHMAISVLGAKQSPVNRYYNGWCMISGLGFVACSIAIAILRPSGLTIAVAVLLSVYGIGCEVISGIFPLNERREEVDVSSKIHGAFSAIGFLCLLPVPLLIGIYHGNNPAVFVLSIVCFALAMLFFCFFIMGDKDRFKDTVLGCEGIWQRLVLLCCYIPIVAFAVLI